MTHRRNCSLSRPCTPSAPPCCSWAACVCCVCECLQPVCKCLCVWANWIIFSGSGGEQEEERRFFFFFLRISGSGGQGGQILQFCLTAVGAFWKAREFELGPGEKCHLFDKSHAWTDVWSSVFIAGGQDPSDLYKLFVVCPWRKSHDCWAWLCCCEPDLTVFLTGSFKHVIVLKQMRGWNSTRRTRGVLLSG